MIREMLVAGALVAAFSSSAIAQSDPVVERQQLMKKSNQELKSLVAMQKGGAPFELAKVQTMLKEYSADYKKAASLFPDNSQAGHETRALPKIWTDKAGFGATLAKFDATLEIAQATIKDEASFKAELPKIVNGCDSCHESYRAPRR